MKPIVRAFSTAFPGVMARVAYKRMNTPQVYKLREHEEVCLDRAEQGVLAFRGFDIRTYTWNEGASDPVLLVHGWEGQAGNFSDLVERLVEQGNTVVAFDGPSHGRSSRGPCGLFDFSDLVMHMLREVRPRRVVSHSFGGVATTYALHRASDVVLERYVMLTTPDRFQERIDEICEAVGIASAAADRLVARIESETKQDVAELNVSDLFPRERVGQLVILHDRDDRVIPIEASRRVAERNGARFIEVTETGHFRILRTPEVLDMVLENLGAPQSSPARPGIQ